MSKVRVLTISVVALLLLNIATLAALYLGRPGDRGPGRRQGPKAVVIERLRFDADQVRQYEALIEQHRSTIIRLDERRMHERALLYQGLKGAVEFDRDSLLGVIADIERTVESTHLAHFTAIRAICKAEQTPLFDALVDDLARLFRAPKPERR